MKTARVILTLEMISDLLLTGLDTKIDKAEVINNEIVLHIESDELPDYHLGHPQYTAPLRFTRNALGHINPPLFIDLVAEGKGPINFDEYIEDQLAPHYRK